MSQLFIQTPAIALYTGMSAAATSCVVTPYPTDIQTGRKLTMTDWGTIGYFTADPKVKDYEEIISFTGITDNGDGTGTFTGLTRNLIGESPYTTPGTGKQHGSGAAIVFSNNPQLYASLASLLNANTFSALNIFSVYAPQTTVDPVSGNDLTRLSYVQALVLGTLTTINVIVPGTAGVTLVAGNSVYFDDPTNQWKKTDATSSSTVDDVLLGIVQTGNTAGNPISVLLQGVDANQTGLTDGQTMYASNTPGAIANSAGTISVVLGISKGTTQLYFSPRFNQQITANQLAALAGTSGTPSSANLYVTAKDETRNYNIVAFAADAGSNDTYVITLSPIPTAYTTGMTIKFKAATINTGPATINVNSLGAKTIVKGVSTTLADGDIAANQFCTLIYDGTNFVLQNPATNSSVVSFVGAPVATGSVITTSNVDTTYTPNFTAKNITIYYSLMGKDNGTTKYTTGQATFNGSSLVSVMNYQDNTATITTAFSTNTTVFGTAIIAGSASGSHMSVVLSITSVTSTQFIVRAAFSTADSSAGSASFYVVATQ